MDVVTLQSAAWRLAVSPRHGAGITALEALHAGAWTPVMRPTPDPAVREGVTSQFSSFTLAPYSNRIREARFSFGGREHQLRPTNPQGTAQHGDVRNRPWRAEVSGDGLTVTCSIDSRDFQDSNYPYLYSVVVEYALHGERFDTTLTLTNRDQEPMPGGFGLHPYFTRRFDGAAEAALCFAAAGVYQTGDDRIPSAGMVPVPPELDFGRPRLVGEQFLDHGFGGWEGSASLEWPASGRKLVMRAGEVFTHLIVFTAPDGTLAIEPVTHATDAFNLAARGVEGTGMRVLQPGESLSGTVSLTLENASS